MKFSHLGQNWTLCQQARYANGAWYFAPRWGNKKQKVWHCLRDKATGAPLGDAAAIAAAKDLITAHFKGPDQYEQLREQTKLRDTLTVAKLLDDYRAAGCPDTRGQLRTGGSLETEQRNLTTLSAWWAPHLAARITDGQRDAYRVHRRDTVRVGDGARTTELELGTLNNALRWAWRTELLRELPRSMKTSYRDPKTIAHRRHQMPTCGDELHALAAWCFEQGGAAVPAAVDGVSPSTRGNRSGTSQGQFECYGWALLLAAHTGLRIGELAMLQASPQRAGLDYPPGFMDDKFLRIRREKHGRNPKIALDDPTRPHLRPLLEAIRTWHAVRYPNNPHLLPGARDATPLNVRGVGRTLDAAASVLGVGKRCPHGLRAYYASTRLAQGITPDTVATELGQSSGDELVRDVYGVDPDDFDREQWTSLADRFTWLPNTADKQPAWNWWTAQPAANIIRL